MLTLFFVLFVCVPNGHAVLLDRNQLAIWIPDFLTETEYILDSRKITLISNDTFNGLNQLQVRLV